MQGYKTVQLNAVSYDMLMKRLGAGCSKCVFEEADGALYMHCAECRLAITRQTYQLFDDAKRASHQEHMRRKAACGEPLRSPSVDASEWANPLRFGGASPTNDSMTFDPKDSSECSPKKEILKLTISCDTTQLQKDLRRLADVLDKEFPIR